MEPTTIASIINATAIVMLVIITWRYVRHTKQLVKETRLARRDNPELKAYLSEPSQEELERRQIAGQYGTFLTFTALLINPGSVPIVIHEVTEKVKGQESKGKVGTYTTYEFQFALTKEARPEQVSLYVFGLPWVIPSDGFAIWSRYLALDTNKGIKYTLTVKFDYSVGETRKETPVVSLPLTLKAGRGFKDVKLT